MGAGAVMEAERGRQNMNNTAIIEIENLTKTFKNATEPAVNGISFSIYRNEIFGLLGPNGAGKTTTISILCGLFAPTSGKVMIEGKYILQHNGYTLAKGT